MTQDYHVGLEDDMDASSMAKRARHSGISGQEFLAEVGQAGVLFDGKPACVHRAPLSFLRNGFKSLPVSAVFHGAVRKQRAFSSRTAFCRVTCVSHGLSEEERCLAAIDPGLSAAVLARVDCFVQMVILDSELNAEALTGMGYTDAPTPDEERSDLCPGRPI